MTSLAEEIGVARVCQLDGYTRTIGIGLHHEVEVVGLCSASCQLGVDVELTLPLAATHTLGQGNLVGVALVGSYGLYGQLAPAVIGKPVAEGIEQGAVVNGLPQVAAALVIPVHDGTVGIVRIIRIVVGRFRAVVVGMILQYDVRDIDMGVCLTAAKVEEQVDALHIDAWHVALPEDVVLACLQVDAVSEVEHVVVTVHH